MAPAVLDRYLVKEVTQALFASTSVLVLIIFGHQGVRLLSEATEGRLPAESILPLLVLGGIDSLILLLPLSLLLAVMMTMGRLYRDHEMSALSACGISYGRLCRSVMLAAVPVAAVLAVLALLVSPWTARLADQIRSALESVAPLTGITPGRFIETGDENLVFFVGRVNEEHRLIEEVFIHSLQDGRTILETAARATQSIDPLSGDRLVLLRDGHRYEGLPGAADFRVLSFARHTVRIPLQRPAMAVEADSEARPTVALWGAAKPEAMAELQRRVSVPISAILLALLALPLSHSAPRQGRYGKLAIGIAIYIVYANLGQIVVSMVERGVLPASLGIWWVHLALLTLIAFLFMRQYGLRWSLRRLLHLRRR
jgi:lipopolysaccharide export system permease protein